MKFFKHPRGVVEKYWLLKSILIMKLTFALIIFLNIQAIANVYSQTKVTINLKSADFKKVISAIEKQSSYHFVYSDRKIPANKKMDINAKNEEVLTILSRLLANSGFTYSELADHLIVISPIGEQVVAGKVTGKVVDDNGQPLPGASIKIKGTSLSTSTDVNGGFAIDAPDNSVLVISYIGYLTKEVTITGTLPITITMVPEGKSLTEVVVTALGIKKEEKRLGYSVTQVGGDEVSTTRETTFINGLAGKVAGLVVQSPPNGAGGSSRVILRGNSSFSGSNQPLYIVDGVPINSSTKENTDDSGKIYGGSDPGDGLSSINPDDIESMSVLKGASAAALYGGQAQAGVIIITTKKGKKNQGLGITFNTNTVLEKMVPYDNLQYDYGRGDNGKVYTAADNITNDNYLTGESWGVKFQGQQVLGANGVVGLYAPQTASERFNKFFKTGFTTTNSLALTKGVENGSYRVSLSTTRDNTPTPGAGYERYNGVIRSVQDYGKKFHTDFKVDLSRTLRLNSPLLRGDDRGSFSKYFVRSDNTTDISYLDSKDANGNYLYTYTNPYFDIEKIKNDQTQNRVLSSANLTYDITDNLHANVIAGVDYVNTVGIFAVYPNNKANNSGLLSNSTINQQRTDVRGMLNYDKKFNKFTLNALVGAELQNSTQNSLSLTGTNFVDPTLLNFSNVTVGQPKQSNAPRSKTNSVFGSAQLGYNNYLFLEVTGRNDWYSALASTRPNFNTSLFYPSANLSFVFTDAFKIDPKILSFGKLRASIGQTGSNPTPGLTDLTFTISPTVNSLPGATISGANGSTTLVVPPAKLKPETTTETEIGTELRFFTDRITVDFAYYNKRSDNFLLQTQLSSATTFDAAYFNAGSMTNKGVEALIGGIPLKTKDFSWNVSVNFAKNKNMVTALDPSLGSNGVTHYLNIKSKVGYPLGSIFGTTLLRDASGNYLYKAVSTDASGALNGVVIDRNNTESYLGNPNPDWSGGITNTFTYKNFSLSFLIDGQFGGQIFEDGARWANFFGNTKASLLGRDGTYIPSGLVNISTTSTPNYVQNTLPYSPYQQYNGGGTLKYYADELSVFSKTFIKFRQITLGYTLPKSLLAKTPIRSATFSLIGRNLFFIRKDMPIFDPESSDSIGNGYGYDTGGLPTSRTYGFNLNVSF